MTQSQQDSVEQLLENIFTTNIEHDGSYIPASAIRKKIPEAASKLQQLMVEAEVRGAKTIGYRLDNRIDCTENDVIWEVINQYVTHLTRPIEEKQ